MNIEIHPIGEWGVRVGALLARRLDEQPGLRLCLPTGVTPAPAYAAFAATGGSLGQTCVFLLDEFVLPPGDPARCDEMLRRDLLDRLEAPPLAFHKLDVDAPSLEEECVRYAALVGDGGLDLTLLGLGANGHLALNEPGSDADTGTRVVELHPETVEAAAAYGEGAPPSRGVTLGLREILASREIWLLVTGGHKAGILDNAINGPVGPGVPGSYLQEHPNTLVLADPAAARLLDREAP